MNQAKKYVRLNVTVRNSSLDLYRKLVAKSQQNISKLVDAALLRQIEQEKRSLALQKLKKLGPAFPDLIEASAHIQKA